MFFRLNVSDEAGATYLPIAAPFSAHDCASQKQAPNVDNMVAAKRCRLGYR